MGAGGANAEGEGVDSVVAWVFGFASGAIGGRAGDWEWTERGDVQALDWKEVEADLGEGESGKSGQDGKPLRSTIQQPVGKILDASKIGQKYFDAPGVVLTCFFS